MRSPETVDGLRPSRPAQASRGASSTPLAAARPLSIVLVRPASLLPLSAHNVWVLDAPPIGLAYLSAALKRAGHRVRIVDAFGEAPDAITRDPEGYGINGLSAERVAERIPADVDLIGVTCMFSNSWIYCRRTVAAIAAAFPDVPIVVGGEHASADFARLLARVPEVLCCVLGEGEETIVDLAAHVSRGLPVDHVPGLAVRDGAGAVRKTAPRARLDVDAIPWPDWDSVPLANYLDNQLTHDPFTARSMPMLASRGCPYQCTFCSSPQMFGTKWAAREPRHVVDEMAHYAATLGARYFEFQDLTMVIRRDWILAFSKLLVERRLDVQWCMPSGTRSEALDAEVLGWMKRSGCRSFAYAPESGSEAELVRIKKKVRLDRMLDSMRAAVKVGMVTRTHLIFGLPGQTKRDVLRSLVFTVRLALAGVHDLGCYAFSPYPGSALYDQLVAAGRIDPHAEDYDRVLAQNIFTNYTLGRSWTPHLPSWAVGWLCVGSMAFFYVLQFLFRPARIVALVRNFLRKRPHTYFERMVVRRVAVAGSVPVTRPAALGRVADGAL